MDVLLLEDDVLIALDLAATLEEMGVTVHGPAHTEEQATIWIGNRRPDLALLDFTLGGHTSERIAERLDEMNVPVIFITGHSRKHIPERFRNYRILQKPISAHVLRDAMRGMPTPA